MANDYYRKSALLEVGGFNETMQVMEDRDVLWRLERAGYKTIHKENIAFRHYRSTERFTLRFILRNGFTYGYYWQKLARLHHDRIGLSGKPIKLLAFSFIAILSFFNTNFLWVLLVAASSWFMFRFLRDRIRVGNCLQQMSGIHEKVTALIFSFFVHILFEIAEELGKLYSWLG
ncbi:MAG: hypothetical protein JSW72_03995, partial [Candidatus Bathyarchaeota archaeon]